MEQRLDNIDGVHVRDLRRVVHDGRWLMEIFGSDSPEFNKIG